jgi:cell division septum initiation protein DivIVA
MNPSQASLERAQALRQRTRARAVQRPPEREEPPFPIVLRGYDRAAVDEHLDGLNRLIEELRTARSPQAAVRQALDRVGEETSAILQRAHETADEITAAARADAHRRVETAQREADSLRQEAERQARALASDSDNVWHERTGLLHDMRKLADSVLEVADAAEARISKSPAEAVTALADSAHAEAQETATVADVVPEDEPRVWREPSQPTEQIDVLELDDDADEYDEADAEHAEHGAYDTGEPHGPYYS